MMKQIKIYTIPDCGYLGKEPIQINGKQLDQFLSAMLKLNAFDIDGCDVQSSDCVDVDMYFGNMSVYEKDDEMQFITVMKKLSDKRFKEIVLTDYPGIITSIFGLDYEKFVPAALEDMSLHLECKYDTDIEYSSSASNPYDEWSEKVLSDIVIDKAEMVWQPYQGKEYHKIDITESLSKNVKDKLEILCMEYAEDAVVNYGSSDW